MSSVTDIAGRALGRCTIDGRIGGGGMGTVYRGWHTTLDIPVAVKVLAGAYSNDAEFVVRFYREARQAVKLDHPNIVRILDVDSADGLHFIIMQFIDGPDLAHVVSNRGPMSPGAATHYIEQALTGLRYAHERGIIHRDIKPDNLMVTRDGMLKITDFGLARSGPDGTTVTRSGMVMGTPVYMPIEQWDADDVDHRADIYAMGITLYHLLSGKFPTTGQAPTAIIRQLVSGDLVPLPRVLPGVNPELVSIAERMMAPRRDGRYATAQDALKAVSAWREAHLNDKERAERIAIPDEMIQPLPTRIQALPRDAKTLTHIPGLPDGTVMQPGELGPSIVQTRMTKGASTEAIRINPTLARGRTFYDEAGNAVQMEPQRGYLALPIVVIITMVLAISGVLIGSELGSRGRNNGSVVANGANNNTAGDATNTGAPGNNGNAGGNGIEHNSEATNNGTSLNSFNGDHVRPQSTPAMSDRLMGLNPPLDQDPSVLVHWDELATTAISLADAIKARDADAIMEITAVTSLAERYRARGVPRNQAALLQAGMLAWVQYLIDDLDNVIECKVVSVELMLHLPSDEPLTGVTNVDYAVRVVGSGAISGSTTPVYWERDASVAPARWLIRGAPGASNQAGPDSGGNRAVPNNSGAANNGANDANNGENGG